jgi:hypothetical protein
MQKYGIKKPTVQKTLEGLVEKGKLAVQVGSPSAERISSFFTRD